MRSQTIETKLKFFDKAGFKPAFFFLYWMNDDSKEQNMRLFRFIILTIGLLASTMAFSQQKPSVYEEEGDTKTVCESGCCANPLLTIPVMLPTIVRNIVLLPISIFWDHGPTFAEP